MVPAKSSARSWAEFGITLAAGLIFLGISGHLFATQSSVPNPPSNTNIPQNSLVSFYYLPIPSGQEVNPLSMNAVLIPLANNTGTSAITLEISAQFVSAPTQISFLFASTFHLIETQNSTGSGNGVGSWRILPWQQFGVNQTLVQFLFNRTASSPVEQGTGITDAKISFVFTGLPYIAQPGKYTVILPFTYVEPGQTVRSGFFTVCSPPGFLLTGSNQPYETENHSCPGSLNTYQFGIDQTQELTLSFEDPNAESGYTFNQTWGLFSLGVGVPLIVSAIPLYPGRRLKSTVLDNSSMPPESKQKVAPYFWSSRSIPLLYLLFPFLLVASDFELILLLPGTSPVIMEISIIAPAVLVGILLLASAMRFRIEDAEVQPLHYLTRWERIRNMSRVMLIVAGLMALYTLIIGTGILKGNSIEILLEAFGVLYLIVLYTMLLPIRFWSPRPADFARLCLIAAGNQTKAEDRYFERALRWFGRAYTKSTRSHRSHLQQHVFTLAMSLNHDSRQNLGQQLLLALQSKDYDGGVMALAASIGATKETVVAPKMTLRSVLLGNELGRAGVSIIVGLASLVVSYIGAVALGPNSVATFENEIGLAVLTAIIIAATIWTSIRKSHS
jgi:hypothetical protein